MLSRLIALGCLAAALAGGRTGGAADTPPNAAAPPPGSLLDIAPAGTFPDEPLPAEIALGDATLPGDGPSVLDRWAAPAEGTPFPSEVIESPLALGDEPPLEEIPVERMPYEASSGGWFGTGDYYGSAEILFMSRGRQYRRVLGYDSYLLTLTPLQRYEILKNKQGVMTTDALPYNVSPAARITVGEYLGRDYLDRDRSLEFTYYGGLSFYQQDAWNAVINGSYQTYLVTPLSDATPGFTGAQQFLTTTNANFNSMEVNYKIHRRLGRDQMVMVPNGDWTRHAERGWLPSLFFGTRLANFNEQFSFSGRAFDQPLSTFGGDYLIQTDNWLWGFNMGGELISRNEFFYWGLRGRAAPAIAFDGTQQQMNARNTGYQNPGAVPAQGSPVPPSGDPRAPFPTGTEVWKMAGQQIGPGFLGDLTILAGWNFTPNSSIQLGYDFLWVAGVATASRQFNLNKIKQNQIDPGGQVFFQGFSFGYNHSW